jgi:hypothetical protein
MPGQDRPSGMSQADTPNKRLALCLGYCTIGSEIKNHEFDDEAGSSPKTRHRIGTT